MSNFKAAVRSLLSTPAPTLMIVATLAIAIGANTAIASVVYGVLLRPLGYGDDSRLVVVWATNESDDADTFRLSPADYRDLRDEIEAFGGQVLLYRSIGSTLTSIDPPASVGSLTVTSRIFRVLGAKPAAGQLFTDEDEIPGGPDKVVITHASWTRRFGRDPSIVGSKIDLDGRPYTVVGVAEKGFTFPPGNDEVELYFPMRLSDSILLDRNHRMFDAVGRLEEGVSVDAARAELDVFADRLEREFPDSNQGWGLTVRPLRDELLGGLKDTLWVLSIAVFLVLLIACSNVANVLIARSASSSRELAVRAALGARAGDLLRRSLAESLLLGLAGASSGIVLAFWGVALLGRVMPAEFSRFASIDVDSDVLLLAAALSLGATLFFGAIPALRSMAPNVLELSKPSRAFAGVDVAGGGQRLREAMVIVEVALTIVLLVGAGLTVRSFERLSRVDPGFRSQGLVSTNVQLPRSRYARDELAPFYERVVDRLAALPEVEAAGAVSDLPMSNVGLGFELEFGIEGLDATSPTARPNADVRLVVPGYFEAMGMTIVEGRGLDRLDRSADRAVVVINDTLAARYFEDIDPLGRSLRMEMLGEVEIVGVVSDVHHNGLQAKYESEIYLPYGKVATHEMQVVAQTDLEPAAVARAVGDILAEMDPLLKPSRVAAMSDLLWEAVARPRFNATLLSGLAVSAALLAMVGTYGVVAYSVSVRTGEIGVRMALGADARTTMGMILRQALGLVAVGTVAGLLAALGASRLMGQLLFEVAPHDALTYALVGVIALLTGALAAWTPARRATRIDPVVALRNE